jgi:hypothetical protein
MTTNTVQVENFSDLMAMLADLGLDAEKVNGILSAADKEREAIAEANKVLEAKLYPADERSESLRSVDAVRDAFFAFAATVSESVLVTPGDPAGGNKNTRSDRRQIEIPTPVGTLNVRLTHN